MIDSPLLYGYKADGKDLRIKLGMNGSEFGYWTYPLFSPFEREAVKALAAGKNEFGRVENGIYRHAGAITLASQCLKCHLPNRKSTEARIARLVISVPISSAALHNTPGKPGR